LERCVALRLVVGQSRIVRAVYDAM
jgi:hypothetical protein